MKPKKVRDSLDEADRLKLEVAAQIALQDWLNRRRRAGDARLAASTDEVMEIWMTAFDSAVAWVEEELEEDARCGEALHVVRRLLRG